MRNHPACASTKNVKQTVLAGSETQGFRQGHHQHEHCVKENGNATNGHHDVCKKESTGESEFGVVKRMKRSIVIVLGGFSYLPSLKEMGSVGFGSGLINLGGMSCKIRSIRPRWVFARGNPRANVRPKFAIRIATWAIRNSGHGPKLR